MTATKLAERRQRRNSIPSLVIVADEPQPGELPPMPPASLSPDVTAQWYTYFASPLAQAVTLPTDLPALRRLFQMYDDIARCWADYLAAPEVEGSTGQVKISHFARRITELEPLVRSLEDRFGLSPKARLELGVTLGDAARSLDDLFRPAAGAEGIPDDLFVQGAAVRVARR